LISDYIMGTLMRNRCRIFMFLKNRIQVSHGNGTLITHCWKNFFLIICSIIFLFYWSQYCVLVKGIFIEWIILNLISFSLFVLKILIKNIKFFFFTLRIIICCIRLFCKFNIFLLVSLFLTIKFLNGYGWGSSV